MEKSAVGERDGIGMGMGVGMRSADGEEGGIGVRASVAARNEWLGLTTARRWPSDDGEWMSGGNARLATALRHIGFR